SKTHLHGTLTFTADTPVRFTGNTVLEADTIVIEEGAVLLGEPATFSSLTFIATSGDFVSRGTVVLSAGNDLTLKSAYGSLSMFGRTELAAVDLLQIQAPQGSIDLSPTEVDPAVFTVFAGNKVSLIAKGAKGSVNLNAARIGSKAILVD